MELMTPTGNPLIPDTFAIISAITRNAAPKAIDPGIRILFFDPTNALAICGPTKPMNPIVPVKQTIPAVIRDTNAMHVILSLDVFTPSVCAQFSPEYMTSSFLYMVMSNALVTPTIVTMIGSSSHPTLDREPTLQWYAPAMSSTAGYATAKEAGEALLANRSKYYGILDGINMYAMGDSYFGGSAVRKGITWVNQMGNKYGMDYINYGIGGSTMSAYVTNKDPMCIRYKTMEKGPCDLILLEGGRNDRSQLVPIGTNDTRDIKTFKGAVNTMIDGMLKTYPDALIVLVTAWYNTAKTSAGKSNVDFANALRELAEYRNDPRVICLYAADKNATGVDMDSAAFRAKYCCTSSDVSHLNGAGMEMIQPYMEKFLAEALAEYKGLTVDGEPIPAEPEVTTPAETDPVTVPEDTTPSPETTPVETTPAPVEKTGCGGVIGGAVARVALISVAGCAVLKKNKE